MVAALIPWVGLGLGYEWMGVTESTNGGTMTFGENGFEFITLQGGGDYFVAPNFAIGPFLSLSFARYSTVTADFAGTSTSMDVRNPAVHEWLQLGVRGTFSL